MDDLIAELIRERFGKVPWVERWRRPNPVPLARHLDDSEISQARRRRILNEALDDTNTARVA